MRADPPPRDYPTLAAFHAANPARRASIEHDYGVHWRNGPDWATWRVSYVRDTGEIYAIRLAGDGPVRLLGVIAPAAPGPVYRVGEDWSPPVDALLDPAWEQDGPPGLSWAQAVLAKAGAVPWPPDPRRVLLVPPGQAVQTHNGPMAVAGRGVWVASYDPEAFAGRGDARYTTDPARALVLPTVAAAFEFWRQVPANRPRRPDGRPNRPLTAITVMFEPPPPGAGLPDERPSP